MALRPLVLQPNPPYISPTFISYLKPSFKSRALPQNVLSHNVTRRIGLASILKAQATLFFGQEMAKAFEFGLVAPDQTIEEAESSIRGHAQALLQVKDLLESESWGKAQKALRRSSSMLKLDIYTLIQGRPSGERAQLRKLYSNLFNSVMRLDYAARDKNALLVWDLYNSIVMNLDDILSRLL